MKIPEDAVLLLENVNKIHIPKEINGYCIFNLDHFLITHV